MARSAPTFSVISPNQGLYLNTPSLGTPPRALQDGYNFRIKLGVLTNQDIGWSAFHALQLNGPVKHVESFFLRDGTNRLIFATLTDLYHFDPNTNKALYITPTYVTGTVTVSGTAVTGVGTLWAANAKAGDYMAFTSAAENDPAAAWFKIQTVTDNTHIVLATSGGTVGAGHAYTLRRTFTMTYLNWWSTALFAYASPSNSDLWFATNGVDKIVKWDGNATFASYSSLTQKAKCLAVQSDVLIMGNLVDDGAGVAWPTSILSTDLGQPEVTNTGLASQLIVHAGTDEIKALTPLGDNLVIYSDRSVTMAQFVGAPLVWAFRQAIPNRGIVGPRAIANFGSYHEFISPIGEYEFDGANARFIGFQVWRSLIGQKDPARNNILYTHFIDEVAELLWVVPLETDNGADVSSNVGPQTAYSEHYLESSATSLISISISPYGRRDFPFTAAGFYTVQSQPEWSTVTDTWATIAQQWNDQQHGTNFPVSITGDYNGFLYQLGGNTANGVAMTSFVHFGRRATSDGRARNLVSRIYPFAFDPNTSGSMLNVTLYVQDSGSGPAVASTTLSYDLTNPEGGHFVTPYRRGRYFEAEFGTTALGATWTLEGYDVDVRPGGHR